MMCTPAATARPSTARATATGRPGGFTLVELMVVMALIALLAGLVTPIVSHAILRAKEATLRENLYVTRKAIDDFYADHGGYPKSLQTLVNQRYLRALPYDPLTQRRDGWVLAEQRERSPDGSGGVTDLHSASQAISSDGQPYSAW